MIERLLRKDTKTWYRFSLCTFYFLQGLIFASWASRIPDIKSTLGMSDAMLGTMLFFIPAGQLCTMALAGWAVGKFGSRRIIIFSALSYPLTLITLALAGSIVQLACCLFCFGIFSNLSNISINAQAVGIERLYRGRSIMASFHGVWSLAGLCGGILGMVLVMYDIGTLAHFCFVYFVGLSVVLLMNKTMLPRDRKPEPDRKTARKFILPDRYLLILGLIAFGAMACEGTMFDWSNVYFEDVVKPPKFFLRFGYVAAMFSMMCGRFTADRLIAKIGVVNVLSASGLTIAAGLFTATLFPFLPSATFGFMLIGLGVSSVVPIAYGLSGRTKIMHSGAAIAVVSTVGMLGFLLGPPVIGFIAEMLNLRWSLGLVGIMGILIAVFARIISKDIESPRERTKNPVRSKPLKCENSG